MEKVTKCFEKLGFQGSDLQEIVNAFTLKEFSKNEHMVQFGKVSRHLGFVETGMFQYYVLKDGEEVTSYISIENTFLASLLSFIREAPSLENVRAITQGSVAMLSKVNLKRLTSQVPGFKDFYIGLLEGAICGIDASRHDLIVLSGEQRYEKMLREEPHLLHQVPLQYLASMLGVTPRHLSRIRGNIR